MKTIYLDPDFQCHVTDDGTMAPVETDAFDGKCDAFIEGYRYIPAGQSWIREDGTVFQGGMIAPWRDYSLLCEFQTQYEAAQAEMADMKAALEAIYAGEVEE